MANHKVRYDVVPFGDLGYRATIQVDGMEVEKDYFDQYRKAENWAKKRWLELTEAYATKERKESR